MHKHTTYVCMYIFMLRVAILLTTYAWATRCAYARSQKAHGPIKITTTTTSIRISIKNIIEEKRWQTGWIDTHWGLDVASAAYWPFADSLASVRCGHSQCFGCADKHMHACARVCVCLSSLSIFVFYAERIRIHKYA